MNAPEEDPDFVPDVREASPARSETSRSGTPFLR